VGGKGSNAGMSEKQGSGTVDRVGRQRSDVAVKGDGDEGIEGDPVLRGSELEEAAMDMVHESNAKASRGEDLIDDRAEGELGVNDDGNVDELYKMEGYVRQSSGSSKKKELRPEERLEKEMQTHEKVAHMYEFVEEMERSVSEQCSKWEEFMNIRWGVGDEDGINLLKAMELVDEEMEAMEVHDEQMILSDSMDSVVAEIEEEKKVGYINPSGGKEKVKEERWAPKLVERPRRRTNDGIPMMEKAMNLKRKNNLELVKGNRFAVLNNVSLKHFADDVNIKLGANTNECDEVVSKLIGEEKEKNDSFVLQNPKILLPVNLEIDGCDEISNPDEVALITQSSVVNTQTVMQTPVESLEDFTPSPKWTEVVRRGKSKTRSRINENCCDEKRLLEY
jgi:hypothetical protein